MQMTRLGRTGLQVSSVCLGTMTFGNQADEATSHAILDVAVNHGITFIDTADVYPLGGDFSSAGRTEAIIGTWLKARGNRHDLVLATKCRGAMAPGANNEGLSRKHIMAACDASLKRLGVDYIDLYQFHAPDPETPIAESLEALTDLVRAGKVRALAVSTPRQSVLVPGVPTMAESGVPNMAMPSYIAVLGPAGMPRDVTATINAQINRAVANDDVKKKLLAQGFEPAPGTPEELANLLTAETQRLTQIIQRTGIKLD